MKATAKQLKYWAKQEAKLLKAKLHSDRFERTYKDEGLTAAVTLLKRR